MLQQFLLTIYFEKRSATKRTALFWLITEKVVVIPYQLFGTGYWSHRHGSRIQRRKMGLIGCPKMLVIKYHYCLRNKPEECSSYPLCSGSLKSCGMPQKLCQYQLQQEQKNCFLSWQVILFKNTTYQVLCDVNSYWKIDCLWLPRFPDPILLTFF